MDQQQGFRHKTLISYHKETNLMFVSPINITKVVTKGQEVNVLFAAWQCALKTEVYDTKYRVFQLMLLQGPGGQQFHRKQSIDYSGSDVDHGPTIS